MIDETIDYNAVAEELVIGDQEVVSFAPGETARNLVIDSYGIPRWFYAGMTKWSAAKKLSNFGALFKYAHDSRRTKRGKLTKVNVNELLDRWHVTIVGLCLAHDKDEADRFEANLDECLTPLLVAPIAQVREFAGKLMTRLKEDKQVPFLVWRSYQVWIEAMVTNAPDDVVRELKTDLAKEIVTLVESDIVAQLPEALARALQWRSPEKLEEVKQVVQDEKAKGNKVRLKGRESCLFMEAGGTDSEPKVCVQI